MSALGFELVPGQHAIIPVMLGDAMLASNMADKLLAKGIYVIGFSFPVGVGSWAMPLPLILPGRFFITFMLKSYSKPL